VGGSGMYVDAVCKGLDQLPKDLKIRNHLNTKLNKDGLESLQKKLKQLDPIHYDKIDLNNSQRLIRALEVCYISSKPYSSFLKSEIKKRSFKIIKFLLQKKKKKLYSNIDQRVDKMVEDGLFEEVKSLRAFKNLNALKTVGYNEVFNFLNGNISKDDAIELIKVNTKKYAKRQMTWFKKDPTYHWIENTDINQSINEIQSILINIKA
jgi:tRNA dimethylallyltransferase